MNTSKTPLLPIALKLAQAIHPVVIHRGHLDEAADGDRRPGFDDVLMDELDKALNALVNTAWQMVHHASTVDFSDALPDVEQSSVIDAGEFIDVEHVARIYADPHRPYSEAFELADKIAKDVAYLQACLDFNLPGIVDLREPLTIAGAA